jgi:serine/threonine protein kinase
VPDSDQIYPGLRHAIENKFPYPIARSFYQLRSISDWLAEIPQLANVLGATLEHLAILALAEYLSGQGRDPALNARLLDVFHRPLSHGTWAGVLRDVLSFLHEGERASKMLLPELLDTYFPRQGENKAANLKALGDDLVQMRNDLIKRTSGELPNYEKYQDFKRGLVEFLQLSAFLKDYPLASAQGAQLRAGIKTHTCLMHMGFHDSFEQSDAQCDLDLERGRVAMLDPRDSEVLYLHPFYVLRPCPEKGCGAIHLFRFEKLDKRRVDYVSQGGHSYTDTDAGTDLISALAGVGATGGGEQLRYKARYLVLESSDTWHKLPPGHRVDSKYEIVEHLRRGGMSDIYKVQTVQDGKELALKLLPFQFLSDREMVRRFRLEATQANRLNHPNITRVIAHGEDLVDHYLVMELATGWGMPDGSIALDAGELTKPLEDNALLDMLKQACEGLDYIHNEGVIHRDIKPGNLLLFDGGQVKLADFGIARSREAIALTMTGLAMGTPDYMSPEQSLGTRDLTPASDIYSLGVVMYELLAGKPPFKRSTPMATMYAHVNDPVPALNTFRPDVPEGLRNIVMKCLEKDSDKRFQSAKELHDALERGAVSTPAVLEAPKLTRTEGTRGHISVAWKPVAGADDYEVELANGVAQLSKTLNVYWESPRLEAGGYQVRVRAYKGGQAGDWSEAVKISLQHYLDRPPPPPPRTSGTGPVSGPLSASASTPPGRPMGVMPAPAPPLPRMSPPASMAQPPMSPAYMPPPSSAGYPPPMQSGPYWTPPAQKSRRWLLWLLIPLLLVVLILGAWGVVALVQRQSGGQGGFAQSTSTPAPQRSIAPTPTSASEPILTSTPGFVGLPPVQTTVADQNAEATGRMLYSGAVQIFGPKSVDLQHDPASNSIKTYAAGVSMSDFVIEADFSNPYDTSRGTWDYGFIFRDANSVDMRVIVNSKFEWQVKLRGKDSSQRGNISSFDTSLGGGNRLLLIAKGSRGYFFVNTVFIDTLDLSARTDTGDISVATGFFTGSEIAGESTSVFNFSVGQLP